jgi:hypothetical protein
VGVVIGGYATASFVASAAVYVRLLHTQDAQAQASAGMYAFGDLLLFVFVLGVVALFPTGLALYYLRPFWKLWAAFSAGALAFAVTGLCAALAIALASTQPAQSLWGVLAGIGVLRMLPAPLLAIGLALSTFIAPDRRARRTLLAATLIEGAVGTYAFVHWLLSPLLSSLFRV